MIRRPIQIRDEISRARAAKIVSELPFDKPLELIVDEYQATHSDAQRRLMWKLLSEIEGHCTDSDGSAHNREWWKAVLFVHFGYVAETVPMRIGGRWMDCPMAKSLSRNAKAPYRMTTQDVSDCYTQIEVWAAERGVFLEAA